jgi:hypothetical protein
VGRAAGDCSRGTPDREIEGVQAGGQGERRQATAETSGHEEDHRTEVDRTQEADIQVCREENHLREADCDGEIDRSKEG